MPAERTGSVPYRFAPRATTTDFLNSLKFRIEEKLGKCFPYRAAVADIVGCGFHGGNPVRQSLNYLLLASSYRSQQSKTYSYSTSAPSVARQTYTAGVRFMAAE